MDVPTRLVQLSQTHLQNLSTCPRKFQHLFLEHLALPPLASSEQQQLGIQFHRLMQQRELGLNIQPMLDDNPQLQEWFQTFQQWPPPLMLGTRQSEQQRSLLLHHFMLVAVYDLLIHSQDRAQIVDWKTYRRPPHTEALQHHWQTRLYPFVLVETSDYRPEQVSMVYWFAEASQLTPSQEHWVNFPYSAQLHQQTQDDLNRLLPQLHQWIQDFMQENEGLPQTSLLSHCGSRTQKCPFVTHCDRADSGEAAQGSLADMGAIAEVVWD